MSPQTQQVNMRKNTYAILITTLALLLAHPVFAISEAQFQPAFLVFTHANSGDKDAIDKADTVFAQLLHEEPGNPVLMAYAGSSRTMKSTTTVLPWKKLAYANTGLALLDKALQALTSTHDLVIQHDTPGSLEVRFIAASTFLGVPSFMNRRTQGRQLLTEVLASPLWDKSPLDFRSRVWMRAAALAVQEKRLDDAQRYYGEVLKNKAPQAEVARQLLQNL